MKKIRLAPNKYVVARQVDRSQTDENTLEENMPTWEVTWWTSMDGGKPPVAVTKKYQEGTYDTKDPNARLDTTAKTSV